MQEQLPGKQKPCLHQTAFGSLAHSVTLGAATRANLLLSSTGMRSQRPPKDPASGQAQRAVLPACRFGGARRGLKTEANSDPLAGARSPPQHFHARSWHLSSHGSRAGWHPRVAPTTALSLLGAPHAVGIGRHHPPCSHRSCGCSTRGEPHPLGRGGMDTPCTPRPLPAPGPREEAT